MYHYNTLSRSFSETGVTCLGILSQPCIMEEHVAKKFKKNMIILACNHLLIAFILYLKMLGSPEEIIDSLIIQTEMQSAILGLGLFFF